MAPSSFDPTWDSIWGQYSGPGVEARAPYDFIVTFVYCHKPAKPHREIRILEVGCGEANNIWYLAREGFIVSGVDASAGAILRARRRLAEEKLPADLQISDYTQLPYPDGTFDLAYDRGSLTCCGLSSAKKAIQEVHRVLTKNGRFFFNPYSTEHTSARNGELGQDNLITNIRVGNLVGYGQLCFYSRSQVEECLPKPWKVESLSHVQIREVLGSSSDMHAEWRVVATK
jgi:SAM-dependent methyltransferase